MPTRAGRDSKRVIDTGRANGDNRWNTARPVGTRRISDVLSRRWRWLLRLRGQHQIAADCACRPNMGGNYLNVVGTGCWIPAIAAVVRSQRPCVRFGVTRDGCRSATEVLVGSVHAPAARATHARDTIIERSREQVCELNAHRRMQSGVRAANRSG